MLHVSRKTVRLYIRDGALRWRDIAPPSSSRSTLRIELASLLELRTTYQTSVPAQRSKQTRPRPPRAIAARRPLRHIRLWDD